MKKQEPYLITERIVRDKKYNPNYGDDRLCVCGHTYDRHFDSYENMDPVGCKYCNCYEFEEMGENPKYLVRRSDYAVFEIDKSNDCYRPYEKPENRKENRPKAYDHFTFSLLTRGNQFKIIKESELDEYLKRHDEEMGYTIWTSRNDGHGGAKGGTRAEYAVYLKNVEDYQRLLKEKTDGKL